MALIEKTLVGWVNKPQMAIDFLLSIKEMMTPHNLDMVTGFSSGKDSIVILRLMHMAGIDPKAFMNRVGIEPTELLPFCRKNYPEVDIKFPPVPFFTQLLKEGMPPQRQQRWCCRHMKEYHGQGLVVLGIRAAESSNRARRLMFEPCRKEPGRHFVSPILHWTDDDVWEFIRSEKLPYPSLYDEGWHRLGCLFCPMTRDTDRQAKRYPKMKAAFINVFSRLVKQRKAQGKRCTWNTGQELWDHWVQRDSPKTFEDDQQCFKFDN
jgi:phosphoadenosine phosphosulfate reductase